MSCEGNSCGVGGWGGPAPGDPAGTMGLSATSAFGGIDLNWTLPPTNPFAVAYVEIYRSQGNQFGSAIKIRQVGGDFYFDRVEPGILYFYWIRAMSINGSPGEVYGPASAQAKATIDQTIKDLTGKIDAGLLAQVLKAEIAKIEPIGNSIILEINDRIAANTALSNALTQVRNGVEQAMTFVQQEITQRKDADSALVVQLNTIAAAAGNAAALIMEEQTVRAAKDEALATDIKTLFTTVGNASSGIIKDLRTVITQAAASAEDITKISAVIGDNSSGIIQKLNTTTTTAEAAASGVTKLTATVGDATSGLVHDMNVVTTKVGSMATDITTVQTTLNGNTASGQVGLITQLGDLKTNVSGIAGDVYNIGSLYFAKVTYNGLIGGFGIYNNGQSVEAGFDVDTFWVGRTNSDKKKPFIISGGQVFIDQAVIQSLVFSKLRSDDGSVIVENGKLKAAYLDADNIVVKKIDVTSGVAGTPTSRLTNGLFTANYANGGTCFKLGIWG